MLENRLKATEAVVHSADDVGPLDLKQVLVKPEDTAGPPSGWGAK